MTEVGGRDEREIEVNPFDQRVGGEHVEGASLGFDDSGVVADADRHPGWRGWHAVADTLDERRLSEVTDGIQLLSGRNPPPGFRESR